MLVLIFVKIHSFIYMFKMLLEETDAQTAYHLLYNKWLKTVNSITQHYEELLIFIVDHM